MSRVELARAVAVHMHGTQKYGPRPYVYHLDQVAEIAKPWGEDAVVIAFLHDAIEDTALEYGTVVNLFGKTVAFAVGLLTDEAGATRKERKALTYEKLRGVNGDSPEGLALVVKAADRLANVRQCVKFGNMQMAAMYREEHPDFRLAVLRSQLNEELVSEVSMLLGLGL